jgi:hypothetical protein
MRNKLAASGEKSNLAAAHALVGGLKLETPVELAKPGTAGCQTCGIAHFQIGWP